MHLIDLGGGDVFRENTTHAPSLQVDLQHDLRRRFTVLVEEFLQHKHHELHGSEIVVEQDHLVQLGRSGTQGPALKNHGIVALGLVRRRSDFGGSFGHAKHSIEPPKGGVTLGNTSRPSGGVPPATASGYDVSLITPPLPMSDSPIRRMTLPKCLLVAIWLVAASDPARATPPGGEPQLNLPRTVLQAGMYRIEVQLATTPGQRATGLMHRQDMPPHEGMLFVFDQPGVQCFWMKNTVLPLTAAFVADDGTIVNLAQMKPMTEDSHCSSRPVRFVLEMNQGWFEQRALKPGFVLKGAPFLVKENSR